MKSRRTNTIAYLEREIAGNLSILESIGAECYAASYAKREYWQSVNQALRPYLHKLAPVELRSDGAAPEEYRLHVPRQYKGKGLPIDVAVSEIKALGIGFDGDTWDELALWMEDHVKSEAKIQDEFAREQGQCRADAGAQVPEIIARLEKSEKLLSRLKACDTPGRAGCLGRVQRRLETFARIGRGMRRYWREIQAIRKETGT